jgi:hypothetical protein
VKNRNSAEGNKARIKERAVTVQVDWVFSQEKEEEKNEKRIDCFWSAAVNLPVCDSWIF